MRVVAQGFRLGMVLALGLLLRGANAADAAGPSRAPILQLEVETHTATIRASALARSERFVVTGSADKSARLWELPSLRLRRVFRLPVGEGPEGRVHDVAVSPDEKWVAVGGWTGWEWDGTASVYFFDVASGQLVARLGGLPNAIRNLAYSPKGEYLAVGLMGGGLRVHRTTDYREVFSDSDYGDRIVSLDFASDGRLAASSADGDVRVYAADFEKQNRFPATGGSEPLEVRFSPNGRLLALGYQDQPVVEVLNTRTGRVVRRPELSAEPGFDSLYAIEWSEQGERLYAAGRRSGGAGNALVVWERGGKGEARLVPTSRAGMGRLLPLRDGGLFWGAADPAMGLLDSDENEIVRRDPATLDFAGMGDRLLVSPDASFVALAGRNAAEAGEFTLRDQDRGPLLEEHEALAPSAGRGGSIEISSDERSVRIGGESIELDAFESVHHAAWSHDGTRVVLATEWALRTFDARGRPIWDVPLSVVAHAVNVSEEGRWVVAALADGTLRWFDLETGVRGPSAFLHTNGSDWVAWMPSGHYAASPSGDEFIGWLRNRRADQSPEFFSAIQFEREFYAPLRLREAVEKGTHYSTSDLSKDALDAIAPPIVEVEISRQLAPKLAGPVADLRIRAASRGRPMERLNVFVNKAPLVRFEDRSLGDEEASRFERTVAIPLAAGTNEIRVEVDTDRSRGIEIVYVENVGGVASQAAGDLYVVAIGVNELTDLDIDLAYAARDAKRVDYELRAQKGRAFREVHTMLVADDSIEPSGAEIERALRFLRNAKPTDTVALFLAGHGLRDRAGNYYFIPRDGRDADLRALSRGATSAPSLLAWDRVVGALRDAVGRRILIVDTCHAQQITGNLEIDWLAKHSASSMFALLAASAPEELSAENAQLGSGLYTEGVVRGLRGAADFDGDLTVRLNEIHAFAADFVASTPGSKQRPQFVSPPELDSIVLTQVGSQQVESARRSGMGETQSSTAQRGFGIVMIEDAAPVAARPRYSQAAIGQEVASLPTAAPAAVDLKLTFESQSRWLDAISTASLDELGAAFSDPSFGLDAMYEIRVVADTGSAGAGKADSPIALAWARAETIRSYLIRHWGIDPGQVRARGVDSRSGSENGNPGTSWLAIASDPSSS